MIKETMTDLDWKSYHGHCFQDNPIHSTRDLVRALYAYDYEVIILTARNEYVRRLTELWLAKNSVPYHVLTMRPNDNFESSSVLKLQQAKDYIDATEGDKQVIVIDDNEEVCEAFCKAGASVLRAQINKRPNCRKFTRES